MTRRILVVDDDRAVLLVLGDALRRLAEDCEIVTARDAGEALRELNRGSFDVMVTDLTLPGMTGIGLTERARTLASDMPVLWITACGCQRVLGEGASLGVYCCMDKPVEIRQIQEAVQSALQRSGAASRTPEWTGGA